MKKFIVLILATSLFSNMSFAADKVSPKIVESFLLSFHDARDISWEETNGFSVAVFTQNGVKKSAYYNEEGQLVVIGRAITPEELPSNLLKELSKDFEGYSVTALFEMQDETGISYYATLTNSKKVKVAKGVSKRWQCLRTRKA